MTLDDIKKISIREYLGQIGINPAKENNRYGMYHSPFREDKDASMKVDYNKNLWIDYGSGEGGSIIDLAMRLNNISLNETIEMLNQHNSKSVQQHDMTTVCQPDSFSFHRDNSPVIKIDKVQPLANPTLISYLKERGINIDIAQKYCSDVYYSVDDKSYFAVGFRNDAGGYELRNKYFKGSTTPKNITTINNDSNTVMIFEGFIDFLSYLSLKNNPVPTIDSAILNSLANLPKAIPFLQTHKTIHAFLDNDEAGKQAVQCLCPVCKEVVDQSGFYQNHKDLNDYLRSRSTPKQAVIKKPSRGMKM